MAKDGSAKYITLRDFVSLPLKFFSVVGIKFFNWDEDDIMTTAEKFSLFVCATNMVLSFFTKTGYLVFEEFENTVQMTQWFLYYTFSWNGLFKMFSVVLGRKTLSRILKDLQSLIPRDAKACEDFKLTQGFHYIMHHSKIMYLSHWTIAFMFIIFPIVQSSVDYLTTKVFVARVPYIMTYPFDITYGLGYIVAYISQFIAGFTISCYFVGSDMLLMCTIYVVTLQFQYLCYRIERFESKNFEQDMKELKDILAKHNLLHDLAQNVNNVFSISILLNYMISIIVIVLIGVQIISGSELLDFIKFSGFFLASAIQVYYVCMFGSQLLEHSALVGESLLGQKWYMADIRYQRMLTLAIARSQKPAHLTAFKFFMISMESFTNLMTTAYQFFTLLKTRMEEHNLLKNQE